MVQREDRDSGTGPATVMDDLVLPPAPGATPRVEVLEVRVEALDPRRFWGAHIDLPQPGMEIDARAFELNGWVLARGTSVVGVECIHDDVAFRIARAGMPRPDLAVAFPDANGAELGGFQSRFSVLGTAGEFEIRLRAVFEDGTSSELGAVRGRHSRGGADTPSASRVSVVVLGSDPASLSHTVDHVLRQSHSAYDVIVAEPAGEDSEVDFAAGHPGIQTVRAVDRHPGAARTAGLAEAAGEYVFLTDGDSQASPDFLADAVHYMDANPTLGFVTAARGAGRTHGSGGRARPCAPAEVLSGALVGLPVVFRTSALESVGGLDPSIESRGLAEWDGCIRLAAEGFGGIVMPGPGDAPAPDVARDVNSEAHRYVLEKNHALRSLHMVDVLAAQEDRIGPILRRNHELEQRIEMVLRPEATRRREELEVLLARLRAGAPSRSAGEAGNGPAAGTGTTRLDWGDLRRFSPVSPVWGADRGKCVDRYYIESFLASNAADVRGAVLEIHDSIYTFRYGGERVERADVLDIDPTNARATVVADLCHASNIDSGTYDCIILTQTLHLIYDIRAALSECRRILKAGGVLLATFPCASKVDPESGLDGDYWRLTPAGLRRLFSEAFPGETFEVQPRGNLPVTFAFLQGLAVEDIGTEIFDRSDPAFPLNIAVRAVASSTDRRESA